MKSSILGILPWTHNQRASCKPDKSIQNSTQSDNMKEFAGLSKANKTNHNHTIPNHSRQRKMPPLLRLNSEGEISSGKHFCDRAVSSSQFDKINSKLRLSNSFDSSYINTIAEAAPTGSSFESPNKNIPRHPSFKKSLSDPIGTPIHQSFPPPSPSSAIRNNFSCPMADKISPFSSSPRIFGPNVNIFDMNSRDSRRDIDMQSKCAISLPCANKCVMNGHVEILDSSSCKNVEKMSASKLNGDETPYSFDCDSDQSIASQASGVNCSSQNSSQSFTANDSSSILVIRKKKRRRPRYKKRKEPKQRQDRGSTPFKPSSCSSPLKDNSSNSQDSLSPQSKASTSGVVNVKIVSPICHIVSSPKKKNEQVSSPVDANLSSPSALLCSDWDHSVDEDGLSDDDLVFEDSSVVFFDNSSPSVSKSKVSKKKKKGSEQINKCEDLNDSGDEQKSSLSGLHFTFSLTLSEDEDNDSSVDWDLSTSPADNDQFLFEFEFNSGLCLDRIIGHVGTTATECPETKMMNKRLRDLNVKWEKAYAPSDSGELSLNPTHQRKVTFASDDDLTTVHIVGDEDRAGEWQHYVLERARFQRRVDDVEKVLAPVLCENHRAKVFSRLIESS